MTQQVINIGSAPNDSTGDPAQTAFDKANDNFTELYAKGTTEGVWNFQATSSDTTTAPVSGRFKTNSGNYRDATQIAINATTIQGIDRASTLRTLLVDDRIQCQDKSNAAAWCRYRLLSLPVDYTTWFQFNVALEADGGVASGDNQEIVFVFTAGSGGAAASATSVVPQGRLTLQTATPVMTTTQSAKTTIYYTPYQGNLCPIYNGTSFAMTTFTELSQVTTDATKSPAAVTAEACYDLFVWNDAGTIRCTRGPSWIVAATVTMTIATPCVVTWTGHPLHESSPIIFTNSGGALPTGITAGTIYYVGRLPAANTFNIATSIANVTAGTLVATSGTQSGTHTATNRDTLRGPGVGTTELVNVNGLMLNANSITNGPAASRGTYVGTIRSNGSSQLDWIYGGLAATGSPGFFGVWNAYNRVTVSSLAGDSNVSAAFSVIAFAVINAGVKHSFVCGLAEDVFDFSHHMILQASASSFVGGGIGYDSTKAKSGSTAYSPPGSTALSVARYSATALGFHFGCELVSTPGGGSASIWGNGGSSANIQSGMWFTGRM